MDQVAQEARVSRATVSRVLRGNTPVNADTRERVLVAISRLGYVPNMMAQALATRGSALVGLLLRDPRKAAYGLLHAEIQNHAREEGLDLITVAPATSEGVEEEQRALQRLLGLRVRGIFVATGVSHADDLLPFLKVVPVVAVGRPESHPDIHGSSYDEVANGTVLANEVLKYGHSQVAVLVTAESVSVPENQRAMAMVHRLTSAGARVQIVEAPTFGVRAEGSGDVLRLVQEGRVTCAMFPTDERALHFMAVCEKAGVRIGTDVSVTGADGIGSGVEQIGLATVRVPVRAVAARAVTLMADVLGGAEIPVRHHRFAGEFIDGRSLATPPC